MSYTIIKNPPRDEGSYIKATPDKLLGLLQEGADRIVSSDMIEAMSDAVAFSSSRGYHVSMMRCDDPSDPGGAMSLVGTFYFHRH